MTASAFRVQVTGLVFIFKSAFLVLKQVPTCVRKPKTNTFDKSIKFLYWLFLITLDGFRLFQMVLGRFQIVLVCFSSFLILVSAEYEKDYMTIKFNSDDSLPFNKMLKLHMLTVFVRSVFEEDDKYYPQVFLDECLYEA